MPEQPADTDQVESVQSIPVPPVPQVVKSSNEILCELFGAFNATPPILEDIIPQSSDCESSKKKHKKHKKHIKKKHKKVKKKKRSGSDSRSSNECKGTRKKPKKVTSKHLTCDSELVDSKRKRKRKLGKFSASDSDSEENEPKIKKKKSEVTEKLSSSNIIKCDKSKVKKEKEESVNSKEKKVKPCTSTIPNSIQENILKHAVSKIVDKVIDSTNLASEICKSIANVKLVSVNSEINYTHRQVTPEPVAVAPKPIKQEPKSDRCHVEEPQVNVECKDLYKVSRNNDLEGITLPVADVFAEDLLDCGIKKDELKTKPDKPKIGAGKITIQNLKFSQVYEATVKQIEEEAKLKAERYEEGELSDSTVEQERSPTPSELSSSEDVEQEKPLAQREKRHRHHHKKEKHRHHARCRERRSASKGTHSAHSHRDRSHSCHHHKERRKAQNKEQSKDLTKEKEKMEEQEKNKDKRRSRERDRSREKKSRERERRRSRERDRSRSRSRDRVTDRDQIKERTRSSERSEKHRHGHSTRTHSHDRTKRNSEEKIDKQKLLEIARKNALNMMKNPSGAPEQSKVAITSGGKTVNELTDFCKLLSKKDADGHESISSNTSHSSDSESEKPFHHPFQIKDRPSSIVLNIRNSVALPVKSLQEKTAEQSRQLRLQFPVSSGQHHRKTESEWIPVPPKKTETAPAPSIPSTTQVAVIKPTTKQNKVFKDTPDPPNMDIGSIVSQRLMAMRKLQENPTDVEALSQMYAAQQNMQCWAESKQQPPGQFTGSTGVKVLSQAELASGYQAWARRDQLQIAAPVNSGMGMALLQKMGWRPGEGLGKNKEGTLQPLLLEVKMDKKGLVAQEELPVRQPHQIIRGPPRSLEGKHPVSLLNEYCSRRKFGPPLFELVDEAGPDHKKNFLFKVRVNGVEYKPAVGSPKKKQARAEAAEVCLKALGILPIK